MDWVCPNCERTYHGTPPEACRICGNEAVVPESDDDPDGPEDYLAGVRERLLDPPGADRSLVTDSPAVTIAFRVIVLLSALVALVVAGHLLLG